MTVTMTLNDINTLAWSTPTTMQRMGLGRSFDARISAHMTALRAETARAAAEAAATTNNNDNDASGRSEA